MHLSLIVATLVGSSMGATIQQDKSFCKAYLQTFDLEHRSPSLFCKFLTADNNFREVAGIKQETVDQTCACVSKYPKYAKSTKPKVKAAPKKASKQSKAAQILQNQIAGPKAFCQAWLNETVVKDVSPFKKIKPARLSTLCDHLVNPPVTTISAEDLAAPNLFLNPTFEGSGQTDPAGKADNLDGNLNLPDWDHSGGMIRITEDGNITKIFGQRLQLYTYHTALQQNNSVSQTVSDLEVGKKYHIYISEAWGCIENNTGGQSNKKDLCQQSVQVDGKAIWARKSAEGKKEPKAFYPTKYQINGPHVFEATETEHTIRFLNKHKKGLTNGSSFWGLYNVTMTGPW
ncbi:hypothetical protein B9Z65_5995 [Elsinoe australis]|uniref:Uncharacterized protein n=1 Tax=Elsinoe australis TaxID=40998 RepID=A0A2P7YJR3_9PEZI|nr:hypothetical protein B9Z65_5995 [Elsinoe australis]